MSVYDVYGFVVAVEGPADKAFSEEYGYFKISESPQKIDLFVKVNDAQRSLPTKLYGCLKGMYIPFDEDEKTLWYDDGVALSKVLYYFECLMWWPSKTSLHAGTVAKNEKAFVFTGGGGVGKTSIVLNLLKNGYDFLGDDWLIIEGNKAFPFPRRVHIFDYNLKDEKIAKQVLGWKRYYYKPMLKLFESGGRLAPHKYLRFAFERLRERAMLSVDVQKLFPEVEVASPSIISKIFYLERRKIGKLEIKKDVTPKELARKMAYVSLYEQNECFREYCRYVYLFEVKNQRFENKLYHDLKIMYETFGKSELYRVIVPENMDLTKIRITSMLDIDS